MKKIITFLIAAGAFISVHAQTSKDEARRVVLGQPKNGTSTTTRGGRDVVLGGENTSTYPNNRNYPYGSREAQAEQVNREYDAKINSIRNNVYLSQSEKERMIAQLEKDRSKKLRQINGNYKGKDYDDDEHHDNGKHKGWTKGKGNQGKNKHED
jgi:hypothetical protein